MMQDFDRTMELVDISANSYGATLAQSGEYTEGLEAATKRLTNAWETLVTNITDSEIVINIINGLTSAVKFIADNTWLLIPVVVILALQAASILATKIAELKIDKEKYKIALQEQKEELKKHKLELQDKLLKLEAKKQGLELLKIDKEQYQTNLLNAAILAEQNGNKEYATALLEQASLAEVENLDIDKQLAETNKEISQTKLEIAQTQGQIVQNT